MTDVDLQLEKQNVQTGNDDFTKMTLYLATFAR